MNPDKDTQQGTHLSGVPLNERHDRQNQVQRFDILPLSSSSSSSSEEEDVATDDVDSGPTSDSKESAASSVSFKSDRSKDKPIHFKGQLSPRSALSSSSSSATEVEDVATDVDSEPTSDSKDSTASSASYKSDESKDELIDLKGQLSPRVSQRCRASPGSSCRSIKTEGSPGYTKAKKRHSGLDLTSSSSSSEEDVAAVDGDDDTEK